MYTGAQTQISPLNGQVVYTGAQTQISPLNGEVVYTGAQTPDMILDHMVFVLVRQREANTYLP